jgi:PAS domain S-box-containing protein
MHVPVAGIGASGGGQDALRSLLSQLPADSGIALLFAQHDSGRDNPSEVLAMESPVPVRQAAAGIAIEPNHLYVTSPDTGLEIANEALRFTYLPSVVHEVRQMPVDHLLRSIAMECGHRSMGVILSGSGYDGSAGIEALKTAGGITFAQDPATAKFDGMPQSAIRSGCIDFVLPPEGITPKLASLARHSYMTGDEACESHGSAPDLTDQFDLILSTLRDKSGVDFSLYNRDNIERRIRRRLALGNIDSLKEYCERLKRDAGESGALQRDLLLDLNHLFRTPEHFESARKHIFPRLAQGRTSAIKTADEELQSARQKLAAVNYELHLANAALERSEDLASLIVEMTATPLLVLDGKSCIIASNPSFNRLFGISSPEVKGRLVYSVFNNASDVVRLREMMEHVLPDQKVVRNFEIRQDFPAIGRRDLVLTVRQSGQRQKIVLGIEDITERHERVYDALRESEERFRSMADAAPVLIWVSGTDKGCTFFNKGWLNFTGRTLRQELGDGWTEGVHRADLSRCVEIYEASFDARRAFQMEYRLRRWDGAYRWVLDNGVPCFESDGTFAGFIGSCVDITDVKATQEADFVRQKLETVGMLANGIAHDFNNLLSGILAHSEVALSELGSGSSPADELQIIRAAAVRGAEIVRQLMIYTGQEREVIEPLDVSAIVEDMLELLQVTVSKHVKVETRLGRNLPQLLASPSQIRQIVMNVITNASEAIGDRDGLICVTTERVTLHRDSVRETLEGLPGGEYVQLEIADTGRGMPPDVQARIFDPFFTTKPSGSHGQGLVVVQRIVQRLRGAIRLTSAPGDGTTFRILLPADHATIPTTPGPVQHAAEEASASREATILVVDDENLLRQAVSKMLRKKGWRVIEASDGSSALDAVQTLKRHIDVMVLDVTLPGTPSRRVHEEARRLRPDMAVIVTSANTEEMAAASFGIKIERFLRKPFRLGDLLSAIQEVLTT